MMFKATCADCGNSCEVPFKPNGSKPVFCRDCFRKQEGGGGGDFAPRKSFGSDRPSFGDKPMFKATCADCGNSCEVPFKPNGSKPVFCRDCFGSNKGADMPERKSFSAGSTGSNYDEQFRTLNAKLDAILKAMAPAGKPAAPAAKAVAVASEATVKAAAPETKDAFPEPMEKLKKPAKKKAVSKKKK